MKATVRVVGMKAGGREHVVAYVAVGDPALLIPQPDNPYDRHAIAVYTAPRAALVDPVVSSVNDQVEHVGMMSEEDRRLLMDRQAGYVPRDVAAQLRLPADGIVGYVSQVRYAPPQYDLFGKEVPPNPAGFDVTAWFDRVDDHLDQDLQGDPA